MNKKISIRTLVAVITVASGIGASSFLRAAEKPSISNETTKQFLGIASMSGEGAGAAMDGRGPAYHVDDGYGNSSNVCSEKYGGYWGSSSELEACYAGLDFNDPYCGGYYTYAEQNACDYGHSYRPHSHNSVSVSVSGGGGATGALFGLLIAAFAASNSVGRRKRAS